MQKGNQVLHLLFIEDAVEWGHVTATGHDRFLHMLVGSRNSAGQVLSAKHSCERWPLQRFLFVSVMADGAAIGKDITPAQFLWRERTRFGR